MEPPSKLRRIHFEDERPTLRGLTTGIVKVRSDLVLKPCVVMGDTLPSWLFTLRDLGFEAIFVVLKSAIHLSEVETLVGDKCAIWCGSSWSDLLDTGPRFAGQSVVGFVDGRVTSSTIQLSECMGLCDLTSTRRPRRPFTGWTITQQDVLHSAVGGITTALISVVRVHNGSTVVPPAALPYIVGRDASTVLSATASTRRYRSAPPTRTVVPLKCVNLGFATHPIYHGGGLLPSFCGPLCASVDAYGIRQEWTVGFANIISSRALASSGP